jgi:hypothetical protein
VTLWEVHTRLGVDGLEGWDFGQKKFLPGSHVPSALDSIQIRRWRGKGGSMKRIYSFRTFPTGGIHVLLSRKPLRKIGGRSGVETDQYIDLGAMYFEEEASAGKGNGKASRDLSLRRSQISPSGVRR